MEAPKEVPVHRKEVYDAIKRHERREFQLGAEEVLPGRSLVSNWPTSSEIVAESQDEPKSEEDKPTEPQ